MKFGTDGLRGVANGDLTPELALHLGRAAARELTGPHRSTFLVGRDPRRSGTLLQAAFSAGVASEGADVVDLGVLPTPAVAYLSKVSGAAAAMVSASHNPFEDNGIKLFAPGGRKLPDDVESRVEAQFAALDERDRPAGEWVGTLRPSVPAESIDRYVAHLVGTLGGRTLEGLHLVVDCANGAASEVGPRALTELGARVTAINDYPDGVNINQGCGSTHLDSVREAVVMEKADFGIAFDGDADRLLACDAAGYPVDGDQLLGLFALDLRAQHRLMHDTVVVTVMTNLGFHLAMGAEGIERRVTPVGDRYVLDALEEEHLTLGGEQSGHLIFTEHATTGDGVLAAVLLADIVKRTGQPLAQLAGVVQRLPQVLRNVRVRPGAKAALAEATNVWDEVRAVEGELEGRGRILLRASGTEPLVRVMVEAPTQDQAEQVARRLSALVEDDLT